MRDGEEEIGVEGHWGGGGGLARKLERERERVEGAERGEGEGWRNPERGQRRKVERLLSVTNLWPGSLGLKPTNPYGPRVTSAFGMFCTSATRQFLLVKFARFRSVFCRYGYHFSLWVWEMIEKKRKLEKKMTKKRRLKCT